MGFYNYAYNSKSCYPKLFPAKNRSYTRISYNSSIITHSSDNNILRFRPKKDDRISLCTSCRSKHKFRDGSMVHLPYSFRAALPIISIYHLVVSVQKRRTCKSLSLSPLSSLPPLSLSSLDLFRRVPKTSCLAVFTTLLIDGNMWPFKARASATVGAFRKVHD